MRNIAKFLTITLIAILPMSLFADDFFDDVEDDFFSEGSTSSIEFNGKVTLGTEVSIIEDAINDVDSVEDEADQILDSVSGLFTIAYSGDIADLTVTAQADRDSINIDEAYTNIYFNDFDLEVGYLKTVWGKGDKLHVLDLLNPTDYSNYFTEDYLDKKMAQPTLKFNMPVGMSGLFELAYIPTFEADTIPMTGKWVPAKVVAGTAAIEAYAMTKAAAAHATAPAGYEETAYIMALLDAQDTDQYYPDTNTLTYGQFGTRFTTSISGYDLGAMYYFGYDKQPVLDTATMMFKYNQMNVFGLEFGSVLFGFNLRGEAAYYLIDDANDTFNYVGGFDRDLPINNLNLNLQVKGNYDMETEEIENMIVCKLSDSYNHEKVTPSVTGIIYAEDKDFFIKPELSVLVGENIEVVGSAGIFGGDDDTTLGYYDSNDYFAINLTYSF